MSDDQSDRVKPWTIKGIPPEARNAAIAAAEREKQNLGEWIARAIRSQIQSDRQASRTPVVVGPEVQPRADLGEIERIVALTAQLAAAGAPVPKGVSRAAYGLLRQQLVILKPGPTKAASSPTEEPDGQTAEPGSPTE